MTDFGFQYWRDSSMLLGVSSKNQEKMREDWEKLIEENKVDKEFQEEIMQKNKKLKEREYEMCQIANANGWDIYPTDSEEEEDSDDPDEE